MTDEQAADQRRSAPSSPGDRTDVELGDPFSAAFDGEPTGGLDRYVRLVPPADDDVTGEVDGPDGVAPRSPRSTMFDPHDIERREYRLLARALTNEDDGTDHLAAMTLVQLVKFLRAAGVSVPQFPETPNTPDPGQGIPDSLHSAQDGPTVR
jgi:hypothetical protein